MFDPKMELLSTVLASVVTELAPEGVGDEVGEAAWSRASQALAASDGPEPQIAQALEARDLAALRAMLAAWQTPQGLLPKHDRDVLGRAMKAFRKRLKITRLDAESSIGGGPMSGGRESGIRGIRPPDRYPRAVWDELARQKRLVSVGQGIYELPPGE